jgi:hypothetical protein
MMQLVHCRSFMHFVSLIINTGEEAEVLIRDRIVPLLSEGVRIS